MDDVAEVTPTYQAADMEGDAASHATDARSVDTNADADVDDMRCTVDYQAVAIGKSAADHATSVDDLSTIVCANVQGEGGPTNQDAHATVQSAASHAIPARTTDSSARNHVTANHQRRNVTILLDVDSEKFAANHV